MDAPLPRIELSGISKTFGTGEARVQALVDIDLRVHPGEVVGLLGPSGSGKSTLLNIIGCILEPSGGRMALDGEPIYDGRWLSRDLRRLRLTSIGFIFQFHNLIPFLTALENVALVLELAGRKGAAAREAALQLLDYLQVDHRKGAYPARLSGGEAQRVAIARALANQPQIVLADEPTAALDSQRAGVVMDLLKKVACEQRTAILVVTHDSKIFDRLDRIFRLRDGRIDVQENGQPRERRIMDKYVCTICDYVYDPAVGDPDNGIAPGTRFEDLPDDWACPPCGAPKSEFVKQQ